jgi:hypothetical protein
VALSKPKIKMTLGSELASEPKVGSAIIAEKDGHLWAFYHSSSPKAHAPWIAASVKDARYYEWSTIKNEYRILVAFYIPPGARRS